MRPEPTEEDQKIKPIFIFAYAAFLLVPCFVFYKGLQSHNPVVLVGASVGILGFSFLLITTIRHNRKVNQKNRL